MGFKKGIMGIGNIINGTAVLAASGATGIVTAAYVIDNPVLDDFNSNTGLAIGAGAVAGAGTSTMILGIENLALKAAKKIKEVAEG